MFAPRFVKQGRLLLKGSAKFLRYKSDLMEPVRREEIERLRSELKAALRQRDREAVEELTPRLVKACEMAAPMQEYSGWRENIEVIFVAFVIAVGIRAYFVQPFKIPTGSMQPTLNGIIATELDEGEVPGTPVRWFERVFKGRSYIEVVAPFSGRVRANNPVTEERRFGLLTYSVIHFEDGRTIRVRGTMDQLLGGVGLQRSLGLQSYTDRERRTADDRPVVSFYAGNSMVQEGQVLARGRIDTGDQVLVNKVAYHFRRPQRGEVFVFRTTGIRGIEAQQEFPPEEGSQHYIKRLAGLPGDSLRIEEPLLLIDGEVAREPGLVRVMRGEGYGGYRNVGGRPSGIGHFRLNEIRLGPEDYFALGDNSGNSSDSRMWGPVPEANLVGPAWIVYLPFTDHWGRID